MQIIKKRVVNTNKIQRILHSQKIKQITLVVPITTTLLKRLGFNQKPEPMTSFLPKICGPISRYNAEGKYIVHKELPKERRVINTFEWHWKDWRGTSYSDIVDVTKLCYPREMILPPSV